MYLMTAIQHWAIRPVRHRPGLYACAIVSLAATLGAFALVSHFSETLLYRPLPYPAGRLFATLSPKVGPLPVGLSTDHLAQLESRVDVFRAVGGYRFSAPIELSRHGRELPVLEVTESVKDMVGLRLVAGRWPQVNEPRAVVIPHAIAIEAFGSAFQALGQFVTVEGLTETIIGVIEDDRVFPPDQRRQLAWRFLGPDTSVERLFGVAVLRERSRAPGSVVLPIGVDTTVDVDLWPTPQTEGFRHWILLLYLIVSILLGLALFTVVHAFFQQAHSRKDELLVRRALGASARHIWTDSVVRASMLVLPGLLIGLGCARLALPMAQKFLADQGRWWMFQQPHLGLAPTMLTVSVAMVVLVAGIAAGALAVLPRTVRLFARLGPFFAGCHALVSVPLVGLLILVPQSYLAIARVDLGFSLEGLSTARIRHANADTMTRLVASIDSAGSDVRATFSTGARLLEDGRSGLPVGTLAAEEPPLFTAAWVSPSYFDVVGMRVTAGRTFERSEMAGVVMNQAASTALFGEQPVLPEVVTVSRERTPVIGVVADMKHRSPLRATEPMVFLPIQDRWDTWVLTVRSTLPTSAAEEMVSYLLEQVSPESALEDWESAESALAEKQSPQIAVSSLLAIVAGIACFACMLSGLYSLMTVIHTSGQNAAIRMALGASRFVAFEQVLRPAWVSWLVATSAGALLLLGLSSTVEALLFGVRGVEPLTVLSSALSVGILGLFSLATAGRDRRSLCLALGVRHHP